jgi:cbb3-type cytochrome oxidase subunit 3
MKQEVLKAWDVPWLPVTALILFVVCFAFYTWWTYRKENKKFYDELSRIPLEDKESV